jgi:hypothetical protein
VTISTSLPQQPTQPTAVPAAIDQCIISQDLGYTAFSTGMSFWLPLFVIVLVYARIFYIARRRARIRSRARAGARPTVVVFSQTMLEDDHVMMGGVWQGDGGGLTGGGPNDVNENAGHHSNGDDAAHEDVCVNGRLVQSETIVEIMPAATAVNQSASASTATTPTTSFLAPPLLGAVLANGGLGHGVSMSSLSVIPTTSILVPEAEGLSRISGDSGGTGSGRERGGGANGHYYLSGTSVSVAMSNGNGSNGHHRRKSSAANAIGRIFRLRWRLDDASATPTSPTKVGGVIDKAANQSAAACNHDGQVATMFRPRLPMRQAGGKQAMSGRRLRNSARTLGLIIGGFVVCWLPFFVLATFLPFCGSSCDGLVPETVNSVVLWLGYSNSLVNPVIYAIWDKSFRQSFRRLARCDVNWRSIRR